MRRIRIFILASIIVISLIAMPRVALGKGTENQHGLGVVIKGTPYATHAPIRINGDSNFTQQNGVIGGDGTKEHPYIIAGWDIDANGTGAAIYIGNTTKYFVIKNCTIHGAQYHSSQYFPGAGIMLYDVRNGTIESSNFTSNYYGIYLYESDNNTILGNELYNDHYGIIIFEYGDSNLVKNNTISHINYGGIYLMDTTNNVISNNTISDSNSGIYVDWSKNIKIVNNTAYNNHVGIDIEISVNIELSGNIMENDSIYLWGSNLKQWNTHIIDESNTVNGKPVYYWKNRTGGTVPRDAGEVILANCTGVKVEYEEISYGTIGIVLGYSSGNMIRNNLVSHNKWESGIYLYQATNNVIENNTIAHNWHGIDLHSSTNNVIGNNSISSSYFFGIYLQDSSNNVIVNNSIRNNHAQGVYIDSGSDNWIYNNTFACNDGSTTTYVSWRIQAYDDGTNNHWNSSQYGNYWLDWAENNNTNDQNHDGIVDWSYKIDGHAGSKDYYPLKNRTVISAPLPPTNLNATVGDNYVNLSWMKPLDDGGSQITGYRIYRNGVLIDIVPASQLWYNDTGVVNGQTYIYYVTAVNSVGESDRSNEIQVTPGGSIPEFSVENLILIAVAFFVCVLVSLRRKK